MRVFFVLVLLAFLPLLSAAFVAPVHVGSTVYSGIIANGSTPVIVVLRNTGQDIVRSTQSSHLARGIQFGNAVSITRRFDSLGMLTATISADGLASLVSDSHVLGVYADRPIVAHDGSSNAQINADDVQSVVFSGQNLTGNNQTICIIDTGIDYRNPAFGSCSFVGSGGSCRVLGGYDFVNSDNDPLDDNFHGTHVAGIAAANGSNLTGVAPGANLIAVKALNSAGSGTLSEVVGAIDWCTGNKTAYNISVISMSLGGGLFSNYCDSELDAIYVAAAEAAGLFVSISSGNDGATSSISAPGCSSAAAAVGSVNSGDSVASTSNDWSNFLLLAPGVSINSTVLNNATSVVSGTSMAAPHVAGMAALLQEYAQRGNGSLATPLYLRNLMNRSGVAVVDSKSGNRHYRIDALTALSAFQADVSPRNFSLESFSNNSFTGNDYAFVNVSFVDDDTPTGCLLEWNNGTVANFSMSLAFGSCSLNVTQQSDGNALFRVYVNDSFGNLGNQSFSVIFDRSAPQNVSVSVANNTIVSTTFTPINVTFTESTPDSCIVSVDGINTTATANSSWCFFNQSISDGAHNLTAFVNDSFGLLNASETVFFTVDSTVPSSFLFVSPTLSNNSNVTAGYLFYNVSFSEDNPDGCLLWLNGTAFVMTRTVTNCFYNHTGLTDGVFDAFVQVNDTAGNAANFSNITFQVDTISPASLALASPSLSNNTNSSQDYVFVNVSFTETNPDSCTLQFNTTRNYSMVLMGSGVSAFCYYNVTGLTDGTHNFTVFVNDSVGQDAHLGVIYNTLDVSLPSALIFQNPSGVNNSFVSQNYLYYNVTFLEEHPDSCLLWVNNTAYSMARADTNCILNKTSLSDGQYDAFVQVNDSLGSSTNSSTLRLYVDTTIPAIDLFTASATYLNQSTSLTVSLNATDVILLANVTLLFTNASGTALSNATPFQTGNTFVFNFSNISISQGNYTLNVTVVDNASNVASNASLNVTIDATLPNAPLLSATANASGFVYLNWSGASDEVGIDYYEVFRNNSMIESTFSLNSSDYSALPLATYVYSIRVYDLAKNANFSLNKTVLTNDTVMPQSVVNVSGENHSNGAVNLTWNAVTVDVQNSSELNVTYSVYRSSNLSLSNLSEMTFLANVSNVYYLDGSILDAETVYLYAVVSRDASNNTNESFGSNTLNHTTVSSCTNSYSGFSACSGGSQSRSRICLGSSQSLTQSCTESVTNEASNAGGGVSVGGGGGSGGGSSGGAIGGGGGGSNRGELFVISKIPKTLSLTGGGRTISEVVIASYYTGYMRNVNLTLSGIPTDWYTLEAPSLITPISNTSFSIVWHPPKNATGNHTVIVDLRGVGTKSAGILNSSYEFTLELPPAESTKPVLKIEQGAVSPTQEIQPFPSWVSTNPAETDYSGYLVMFVLLLIGGVAWFAHEHRRWDQIKKSSFDDNKMSVHD